LKFRISDDLPLLQLRLYLARLLVALAFLWPFVNYESLGFPGHAEVNFIPAFFAAALLPEVTLRNKRGVLLSLLLFGIAWWGSGTEGLIRLAIGVIPVLFIFNLTLYLGENKGYLFGPNLAYRALQVLALFSLMQTIDLGLPIIPRWFTHVLTTIIPRYTPSGYDDSGIRGVQGWASEPAGAALMGIAFALVDVVRCPQRRWRVLSILVMLLLLNHSIYALVLTLLFALCCLSTLGRKIYLFLFAAVFSAASLLYIENSARFAEMQTALEMGGLSLETNRELQRVAQIFFPLLQFPHIYSPPQLPAYDGSLAPLGLLPVVIAYGSIGGVVWLVWLYRSYFGHERLPYACFAFLAGFVLLFMASPDMVPSIVALSTFLVYEPAAHKVRNNFVHISIFRASGPVAVCPTVRLFGGEGETVCEQPRYPDSP
jgi:hypothetical protein